MAAKKDTPLIKPHGTLVYVTRYALTQGLVLTTIAEDFAEGDRFLVVRWKGGVGGTTVFSVNDLAWSEDAARAAAERLRTKRLASLSRSALQVRQKLIKLIDETK